MRLYVLAGTIAAAGAVLAVKVAPAQACSIAHQRLHFLLGQSGSELVVLSLDLVRGDVWDSSGVAMRWEGRARLKLQGPDGEARVHEELGPVDAPAAPADYSSGLEPLFTRAQQIASNLPSFTRAKRPRYRRCDRRRTCGRVAITVRDGRLHIRDGSARSSHAVPRPVLERLLRAGPGIRLDEANAGEIDDALGDLRIVHLLRYRIGRRDHLVVNLGSGGDRHAWPELRTWPPRGCTELATCPPATTTLHHGVHLDVLVD